MRHSYQSYVTLHNDFKTHREHINSASLDRFKEFQDRWIEAHADMDDRVCAIVGRHEDRFDKLEERIVKSEETIKRLEGRVAELEASHEMQAKALLEVMTAHERLRRSHNDNNRGIPTGDVPSPFSDETGYVSAEEDPVPIPDPSVRRGIPMGGSLSFANQARRQRRRDQRSRRGGSHGSSSASSHHRSASPSEYQPAPRTASPMSVPETLVGPMIEIDVGDGHVLQGVSVDPVPTHAEVAAQLGPGPVLYLRDFIAEPSVNVGVGPEEVEEAMEREHDAEVELEAIVANADVDLLQ
jgi:uncharacterized coiled-coil protein SlyX